MGFSIQDYLKKINSRLSFVDILSLFVTTLMLLLLLGYLGYKDRENKIGVQYILGTGDAYALNDIDTGSKMTDSRAFGSIKGKTYTFSWCQGATRISPKNKIYFASEEEAKGRGRTLSKMCKK